MKREEEEEVLNLTDEIKTQGSKDEISKVALIKKTQRRGRRVESVVGRCAGQE